MAFSYSPRIITDGLVLYLDAGNPYSYVSGSTVWNDLSRSQLSGSLINGPTYNSANNGSIVFDGVNDYGLVNNVAITGSTVFSMGSFSNAQSNPSSPSGDGPIIFYGKETANQSAGVYYRASDNYVRFTAYGGAGVDYATGFLKDFNIWHYWTVVYNGSTVLVYRDGVADPNGPQTRSLNITENKLLFGGGPYNSSYLQQKISSIQIYNRALSAQEVLQNYNATKGRFGLT
jgi:hypothetical protein